MNVYVLVGLPGSGKSTQANLIKEHYGDSAIVLSSDEYRLKMFGSLEEGNKDKNNTKVSEQINKDLSQLLKNKTHEEIVYDATNVSRKRRRALYRNINEWSNNEAMVVIKYIQKSLKQLMTVNDFRKIYHPEKYIPKGVIKRMYIDLQVPRVGVDCDVIEISASDFFSKHSTKSIDDFPMNRSYNSFAQEIALSSTEVMHDELIGIFESHDCEPYHMETISQHIDMCVSNSNILHPFDKELLDIAKFHDLGKSVTKTHVVKDGISMATYTGHANVSANYYLSYLVSNNWLNDESADVVEAIHQHMNAHQGLGDKNIRNNRLTERVIELTEKFKFIDTISKITKEELQE